MIKDIIKIWSIKRKKLNLEKEAAKEAKARAKQAEVEKQIEAEFAEKKAKGTGSPIDQLKVWLDKTPFKSENAKLKRDTFNTIIAAVMALKSSDLDSLCGDKGQLNDRLALTLSKYIFKAFDLIAKNDQCKFFYFCLLFYRTYFSRAKWTTFTKSSAEDQGKDGQHLHPQKLI